jgi:hypothetical protein
MMYSAVQNPNLKRVEEPATLSKPLPRPNGKISAGRSCVREGRHGTAITAEAEKSNAPDSEIAN